MSKKYTLVLGDKTFEIDSPLTFKQLRVVEPAILRIIELRRNGSTEEGYDKMADAILTAVMRNNPEFTRADLDNTGIYMEQVNTAFHIIGVAAGLLKEDVKAGEETPGEAQAETQNPSTGA